MSQLRIWKVALPAGAWTRVSCPYTTRQITLSNKCGQDLLMRSDQDDSTTEDDLPNGAEQPLGVFSQTDPSGPIAPNITLLYMKPSTGSDGQVIVRSTP